MILPLLRFFIKGTTALQDNQVPVTFTDITLLKSSRLRSSMAPRIFMPALLMRMSTCPKCSRHALVMASDWSWRVMSATYHSARIPYSTLRLSAASFASWAVLETIRRLAPAEARPAAMARPKPLDPPVIMAALPVRSNCRIPGSLILSIFDYF